MGVVVSVRVSVITLNSNSRHGRGGRCVVWFRLICSLGSSKENGLLLKFTHAVGREVVDERGEQRAPGLAGDDSGTGGRNL